MPTGWLFEMKKELFAVRAKGPCSVHLVPYSEHSRWAADWVVGWVRCALLRCQQAAAPWHAAGRMANATSRSVAASSQLLPAELLVSCLSACLCPVGPAELKGQPAVS